MTRRRSACSHSLPLLFAAVPTAATCDASLGAYACLGNGDCVSGACACDAGWRGERCAQLDLRPAARASPGYRNESMRTWGGAALRSGGGWHMFVGASKEGADPSAAFGKGRIVRLEAAHPAGPYVLREVVYDRLGRTFRANAHVLPGGGVLIVSHGSCPDWTPRGYGVIFLTAPAVTGPWACRVAYNSSNDGCEVDDPAGALAADGSMLIVYRNKYGCGPAGPRTLPKGERVGLLWAPHWTGTFAFHKLTTDATPLFGFNTSNEDPFVWSSPRGMHMLVHAQGGYPGCCEDHKVRGAYAFCAGNGADPACWRLSEDAAWAPNITWDDGTVEALQRRQRPALIFGGAAGTYLVNGVDAEPEQGGVTWGHGWTLLQPLANAAPAPAPAPPPPPATPPPPPAPPTACGEAVLNGTRYVATAAAAAGDVASAAACCALCDASAACRAWWWKGPAGQPPLLCSLYATVPAQTSSKKGSVSGHK